MKLGAVARLGQAGSGVAVEGRELGLAHCVCLCVCETTLKSLVVDESWLMSIMAGLGRERGWLG